MLAMSVIGSGAVAVAESLLAQPASPSRIASHSAQTCDLSARIGSSRERMRSARADSTPAGRAVLGADIHRALVVASRCPWVATLSDQRPIEEGCRAV